MNYSNILAKKLSFFMLALFVVSCAPDTNKEPIKKPEDNRFTKIILSDDLNEPMELAVAPDGKVFFIERHGQFSKYDPNTGETTLLHTFELLPEDPEEVFGNGLMGVTLDPDFKENRFIYFYYTPDKLPARQNLSRFVLKENDELDMSSEIVVLEVPIEREVSAHTGGSLAWDKDGNLYLSTGDNTVPFASGGYAPIDEIEGRITFDAQRSSGNTNDLRGKVIRIHPEADGTYTIPEGNLFPEGTEGTRPEIFVMGTRNPYRISVDQESSILYWGEVGPDAGNDGDNGPRGYDEINQAKQAGNYGWPYFVGNSKPYPDYNFETKELGDYFNPEKPINESVNNTGLKELPPAQSALIWYPYQKSEEFPLVGEGGRNAMAGPVYHFDEDLESSVKFPEYYDKALFIYDWMRSWVFAVRLDENYNFVSMERFMESNGDFRRPMDLEVGPDGAFYMLEYGSVYGIDNVDARLVRIEYNGGNRAPESYPAASDTVGTAPLTVTFNGDNNYDPDSDDEHTYQWIFEGTEVQSTEASPSYTFEENGVYQVKQIVTDAAGAESTGIIEIKVGNTLPVVTIKTEGNRSFFFDDKTLPYEVTVEDAEDTEIIEDRVHISFNYVPKVSRRKNTPGHQMPIPVPLGESLIRASDCQACHQWTEESVGPNFIQIAQRYQDQDVVGQLANKIIEGGSGNWGQHYMNGHPQVSQNEAKEMVRYILSLAGQAELFDLPRQGAVPLNKHQKQGKRGRYVLKASYTDGGGAIVPLTGQDALVLRSNVVEAEDADELNNIGRTNEQLGSIHNGSWFMLKQIDLTGIKQITYNYSSLNIDATLEVRVGSPTGDVISTFDYKNTGDWSKFIELSAPVNDPGGINDLYFVFKKDQEPNEHIFTLDWLSFDR
ncbi:PQQ-dependent sugar dehydrogenase [Albibacterium profundi]|uniref:PQQ-dependent sugar dehydrogenase n=1 Tax=Albibacterium profundi TaxID=3134906 RepID=A0ABV5C9T3_9SPHI